jgi:hypothetical protein
MSKRKNVQIKTNQRVEINIDSEVTAELRGWSLVGRWPELVIVGQVYNDSKKRFVDGRIIRTSVIQCLHTPEGEPDQWFAVTLNSVYKLF